MISYGSQQHHAEMPYEDCSHQLGEGHEDSAKMSIVLHPSRPVYGSLCYHAAMPIYDRSHLFTRGQLPFAELSHSQRLSREGSANRHRNVMLISPFPTSLRKRSGVVRSNAIPDSSFPPVLGQHMHTEMSKNNRPILTRGHKQHAAMPMGRRLSKEGSTRLRNNAKMATPFSPVLGHPYNSERTDTPRPILTRGQTEFAEMPFIERLATKEIQYGYKI